MSKRYVHQVADPAIVDAAGLKALADTNPTAYPVGALYALQNGVLCLVTVNDGTAVTVVTVQVV